MAKRKTTKSVEPVVETTPTIKDIPTGILPEEIVEALPETGEGNKVYRRLIDPNDEMQYTDDFIWYDGEWHEFSFENKIFGAYFERYQNSVNAVISDLTSRIEALEGGGILLIDTPVEQMQGTEVEFLSDVPEEVYIESGDTVKIEVDGLHFDGLGEHKMSIRGTVEVTDSAFRISNDWATVQFDEWGENKYLYLNVYDGGGQSTVNNPSCDNLKVTLIKGVAR